MDGMFSLILLCGIINFMYHVLPVEGAGDFRLEGDRYLNAGAVVEIGDDGSRVALICDSLWGIEEATVVCKSLNYPGADLAVVAGYFDEPDATLPAYDEVTCTGMEEHLLQCNYTLVNRCPNSGMGAGAICTSRGSLRLANSSLPGAGRVEMYAGSDVWGTICDYRWDLIDARIACRQLGYPGALEAIGGGGYFFTDTEPVFGRGSGPILVAGLACWGYERYLDQCSSIGHDSWIVSYCSHAKDAGVVCDAKLIRLSDGDYTNQGRVEVYYGGTWGTIAPTPSWDINAANVACRELGYTHGAIEAMFVYGGEARVLLDEVTCQGNESRIAECESLGWAKVQSRDPFPSHYKLTAGVSCLDPTGMKLLSGSTSFEGVVEYRFNSDPGLICDPDWSEKEANVTCRQLGYQYGRNETPVSLGTLSGTIFYRDYQCDGSEPYLWACPFTSVLGCDSPGHIAQVKCGPPNEYDIRLQGSEYTEQGRVEVFLNNEWGAITDTYFSQSDQDTACRQLGFKSASYLSSDGIHFERGTGNIAIDDLDCSSADHKISNCSIRLTGSNSSNTHDDELEVLCYPFVSVANHPVRLINEKGEVNQDYGKVEIYHDGVWGGICGEIDAEFLCRELGHSTYGTLRLEQYNSSDPDWIWFSFVTCYHFRYVDLFARHLFQCRFTPWGDSDPCSTFLTGVECNESMTTEDPGFNNGGSVYRPDVANGGIAPWKIAMILVYGIAIPAICVMCCRYQHHKAKKTAAAQNNVAYTSNDNGVEGVSCRVRASPPPRYVPSLSSTVDLPPSYDSILSPSPVEGNGVETVSMASPPPRYAPSSSPSSADLPPSYDSVVMSPSPVDGQ